MRVDQVMLWLLSGLMLLGSRSASAQCDPKLKACKSFIELAKAQDRAVSKADLVCFYDGTTPSGDEDEFFILMDGKKSAVKSATHPAIFMADFAKGQTVGLRGYGPMTKQEALSLAKARVRRQTYETFDENEDRKQVSEISYGDESVLQWVDTTTIRTSTLRFQKIVEFPDENGGHSLDFTGHCYQVAPTTKQ